MAAQRRKKEIAEEVEVAYQYKYKEHGCHSCYSLVCTAECGDTRNRVVNQPLYKLVVCAKKLFSRYFVNSLLHLYANFIVTRIVVPSSIPELTTAIFPL